MKLKKISIRSLASLSDAVVDFASAPLSNSPLFLICGETGSGKTTILDAISLALYGKTPRLNSSNRTADNSYERNGRTVCVTKPEQLIKRGRTSAYVELDFEDNSGQPYKAFWEAKIPKSKKAGVEAIASASNRLVGPNGEEMPKGSAVEVIGLDYDQFCRTTMLAQGRFTEFLKAKTDEKSAILEKITGTEIYSQIGKAIHESYHECQEKSKFAKLQLKGVELLGDETRAALEAQIASFEALLQNKQAEKSLLDNFKSLLEKEKTSLEKMHKLSEEKANLKEEYKRMLCEYESGKIQAQKLRLEVDTLIKELSSIPITEEIYSNADTVIAAMVTIANSEEKLLEYNGKLAHAQQVRQISENEKAEYEEKKQKLEMELLAKIEKLRQMEDVLSAIDKVAIVKEEEALKAEIEKVKALGDALVEQGKMQKKGIAARTELEKTKAESVALGKFLLNEKKEIDSAVKQWHELKKDYAKMCGDSAQLLADLRKQLRDSGSDLCPLCGASIGNILSDDAFENLLSPIREKIEALENATRDRKLKYDGQRERLNAMNQENKKKETELDEFTQEYISFVNGLMAQCEKLGIEYEDAVAQVTSRAESLSSKREEVRRKLVRIAEAEKARDAARKDKEDYEQNVIKPVIDAFAQASERFMLALNSIASLNASVQECNRQKSEAEAVVVLHAAKYADDTPVEDRMRSFKEAVKLYKNALQNIDSAKTKLSGLEQVLSDIEILDKGVRALDGEFKDLETEDCDKSLEVNVLPANVTSRWGSLHTALKTCIDSYADASGEADSLRKNIEEIIADDASLAVSADEILERSSALEKEIISIAEQKGSCNTQLEADTKNKQKFDTISAGVKLIDEELERWSVLDKSFGGDGGKNFKAVAQGFVFQDILNHANAYLSRISDRYELICEPKNLLVLVRDKDDFSVRSESTLSGGESFIVSLSLALGLSSLNEGGISVDTIFIDEGFGTLSSDMLSKVMETLENLTLATGKRVGIISHVSDLRDRIPTKIVVEKLDPSTSRIRVEG